MFGQTFEYSCPHCDIVYMGEIEDGKDFIEKVITCEDCEKKFKLYAEIEILVTTTEVKEGT